MSRAMTLEERAAVLRSAMRMHAVFFNEEESKRILRETFPELFSSPPTHWLAPMEASDEMQAAGRDYIGQWLPKGQVAKPVTDQWQIAREVFAYMRDTYRMAEERADG